MRQGTWAHAYGQEKANRGELDGHSSFPRGLAPAKDT